MPPPVSSTSILSFTKRIIRTAVQAKRNIKTFPARPLRVLQQTFPSLKPTPTTFNNLSVSRNTSSRLASNSIKPFSGARSTFSRAGYRPTPFTPRGPAVNANVGLGVSKARTFASAPKGVVHGKVPIGLRALAHLLNSDDSDKGNLPRASRYKPYSKERKHRRLNRSALRSISIDSSAVSTWNATQLSYYFPYPAPVEIPGLTLPETLVTPGQQTILSLPLSPSFDHLLSPSSLPYREAEIGVAILSRLTHSIVPIHQAFSTYAHTRVFPLLAKLDSLGVLSREVEAKVEMEVMEDQDGNSDILRIVFKDRSIKDVKEILGESLRESEEGEWWGLSQGAMINGAILSKEEQGEIIGTWSDNVHPSIDDRHRSSSDIQLVFPTIDVSTDIDFEPSLPDESESQSNTPVSDYSWPASPLLEPTNLSLPLSLTSSLSLSSLSDMDHSVVWSIAPSEDDEEVESDLGDGLELSRVWSEGSVLSVGSDDSVESRVGLGWAGSGEGFGLAQPW